MTNTARDLDFPPPYHLCNLSRTQGTFLWFSSGHGDDVPLATTGDVLTFVNAAHPHSVFMLSTMRTVLPDWKGPNSVCMAVCDPMCSVAGRRRPVRSLQSLLGARVRVLGFVIGGFVQPDAIIPPNHGVEDGCIPFDLDLFPKYIVNLPRSTN